MLRRRQSNHVSHSLTFLPVDRAGQRVLTRHVTNGAELRAELLGEKTWAVLVTNGETSESQLGRMFDEAGIVTDPPAGQAGPLRGSPQAAAQGMADATFLTALRADYEIRVPGKAPHTVSRYLFNSLGAEAHRSRQIAGSGGTPGHPASAPSAPLHFLLR